MSKILDTYLTTEAELNEGWRQVAAAALMGAAAGSPLNAAAKDSLPTAYTQNISDDSFINYLKQNENGIKSGFENGVWKPHKSAEGGLPTIAYGHKIESKEELARMRQGITEEEAVALLKQDIEKAKVKAAARFKAATKRDFNELPTMAQKMLIDLAFNSTNSFPKFNNAVASGNLKSALAEYERSYKDAKGGKHMLTARNESFRKTLLEPWMVYIKTGFPPIKGKAHKIAQPIQNPHTTVTIPAETPIKKKMISKEKPTTDSVIQLKKIEPLK